MDKIKHFIEQSWLLIVSAFFFGLLLAATNYALEPRIIQNKINKLNEKAGILLPAAERFVPLEFEEGDPGIVIETAGKAVEIATYKGISSDGDIVGWAFNVSGSGFADRIELVLVVDKNFAMLKGYGVLMSNETPGFGDKIKDDEFRNQFKGAPVGNFTLRTAGGDREKIDSEIVSISGATISSDAVVAILNNSLGKIKEQMAKKGLIGDGK